VSRLMTFVSALTVAALLFAFALCWVLLISGGSVSTDNPGTGHQDRTTRHDDRRPVGVAPQSDERAIPASATPGLPADTVLVCGQPTPRALLERNTPARAALVAIAAPALEAFAQRLPDEDHGRAVAVLLRMRAEVLRRHGADDLDACVEPACVWQRDANEARARAPFVAELARLAAHTKDPSAFTLASAQCGLLGTDVASVPQCLMLSARRWAAIDPGNGHAWLALAVEEPAALEEAIHRAALAPQCDDRSHDAWHFLEQIDPLGGVGSIAVQHAVMSLTQDVAMEGLSAAIKYCTAAGMRDANRRQVCERLANGIWHGARGLTSLHASSAIATRVGMPEAMSRKEEARVLALNLTRAEDSAAGLDRRLEECSETMPRGLAIAIARHGEVGALRGLLRQ
jgi:hypothetical protein